MSDHVYTYEIRHYTDGSVESERFHRDNKLHRDGDRPAIVCYYADGSVSSERFYRDGVMYTLTPARTDTCDCKIVEIDGVKYKLKLI